MLRVLGESYEADRRRQSHHQANDGTEWRPSNQRRKISVLPEPTSQLAAPTGEPRPSKETYEQGRAWEERLKSGACSRLRDRRTDSSSDVAECARINSQKPLCMDYS